MSKPLLVFAMKEESQDVFDNYNVLHTGIGKVNAACGLTKHLAENERPGMVVNLGSAGSTKFPAGSIVNPTRFIQRDMDVTELGFALYQTPFSDDPVVIEYGQRIEELPEATCGTGDNFHAAGHRDDYDLVEMESYALALICRRENIPFLCLKYISDGGDEQAGMDWYETLHQTAEALRKVLDGLRLKT